MSVNFALLGELSDHELRLLPPRKSYGDRKSTAGNTKHEAIQPYVCQAPFKYSLLQILPPMIGERI